MTKNPHIASLRFEQVVLVALGASDPTPRELALRLGSLRSYSNLEKL